VNRRAIVIAVFCALSLCADAAAATHLPGFRSPSGNIECLFLTAPSHDLLCKIRQASYTKALQDDCIARDSLDWHGFLLGATTKAHVVCSGGILYTGAPRYVTLAYGKTMRHGAFTCVSRRTGVTCTDGHAHGLFVSRDSYRLW
jgi:hypothetical protein